MQSIYINQQTQDFELDAQGNIVNMNSLLTEMFMRLKTPRGFYIYDPEFGSDLYLYTQKRQKVGLTALKQTIVDALQPILIRGDIQNIDFKLIFEGLGFFKIQLTVLDSSGKVYIFPYSV